MSIIPFASAYATNTYTISQLSLKVKAHNIVLLENDTIDLNTASAATTTFRCTYYDASGTQIDQDEVPSSGAYSIKAIDGITAWRTVGDKIGPDNGVVFISLHPAHSVTANDGGLKGAETTLDGEFAADRSKVKLTITPDEGKNFKTDPTVTADNASLGAVTKDDATGAYECEITDFSDDTIVTVVGEAKGASATLDKTGLKKATAELSKSDDLGKNDRVTLTVTPDANYGFPGAAIPTVTADKATAGSGTKQRDGSVTYEITNFTGDTKVTVVGEAKEGFKATLVTKDLKGATATLSKTSGIFPTDAAIDLVITPEAGKKFAGAPTVTTTSGTVTTPQAQMNGSYYCEIENIQANATITVVGEAKGDDSKPVIKINGNSVHPIGSGQDFTVTCSLPLDELIQVYLDGQVLDAKNYDLKSGSTIMTLKAAYLDTLSVGKHTLKLSYTEDRAASVDFTVAKPTSAKSLAKTGDPVDAAPIAVLGLTAALAAFGAAAYRRKSVEK